MMPSCASGISPRSHPLRRAYWCSFVYEIRGSRHVHQLQDSVDEYDAGAQTRPPPPPGTSTSSVIVTPMRVLEGHRQRVCATPKSCAITCIVECLRELLLGSDYDRWCHGPRNWRQTRCGWRAPRSRTLFSDTWACGTEDKLRECTYTHLRVSSDIRLCQRDRSAPTHPNNTSTRFLRYPLMSTRQASAHSRPWPNTGTSS